MADRPLDPGSERRESPRVPMRLLVRNLAEGGSSVECDGDLSLGGVSFQGAPPSAGSRYEVSFRLPHVEHELRVQGESLPMGGSSGSRVQLRFVDLDTVTELAIAKYLDDLAGTAR
jgi:hypothetical protein